MLLLLYIYKCWITEYGSYNYKRRDSDVLHIYTSIETWGFVEPLKPSTEALRYKKTHNENKILTTNITIEKMEMRSSLLGDEIRQVTRWDTVDGDEIEPLRWQDTAGDEMRNGRDQLKRTRSIEEIERVAAENGEIEDRRRSLKGSRRRNRRSFQEDRHCF